MTARATTSTRRVIRDRRAQGVIDAISRLADHAQTHRQHRITAPDRFVGDLSSDISGKRGRCGNRLHGGDLMSIKCRHRVKEYQSRLRSVTGGQGAYTMEFSHYAPVPPHTQQQLASQFNWRRRVGLMDIATINWPTTRACSSRPFSSLHSQA
jgi:hypothetical protein